MKEKISVIGIGRLGLSFALLLDSKGYDVYGSDVDERYVESLREKTFKSKEPLVNELLASSKMSFTTYTRNVLNHCDTIFVFVPTPSKDNGEYDHHYIEQVVHKMILYKAKNKTLIICCTVMPNYCDKLQERLSELNINVVYNPFLISQGSIINDLKNANIVLVGGEISTAIRNIYISIMDKEPNFKYLSLVGAEIAKISINCFLTTKISFANRIGEICINSGIESEVSDVLNAIGSDRRIGNEFLRYGYGFSGVCLPRDNRALGTYASTVGVLPQFQEMIDTTNEQHLNYLYEYFIKENTDKDIPFIFHQLSYKRGVDILTESQPLKLCLLFLEGGYKVNIVEGESVICKAKNILKKYEDMVSYVEDKNGFVINIK